MASNPLRQPLTGYKRNPRSFALEWYGKEKNCKKCDAVFVQNSSSHLYCKVCRPERLRGLKAL